MMGDSRNSPPWLLDMHWSDVGFAHWRADATRVAAHLPPGIELDRFEGDAWVSVVPFRLSRVRLRATPVLPGLRDVPELNLRTYVRVGERRGIWFFSLDAGSPLAVRGARIMTGLPYFNARTSVSRRDGTIFYESERRERAIAPGAFAGTYRAAGEPRAYAVDSLEAFLHERYAFFSVRRDGRLMTGRVLHERWTVAPAAFTIARNTLGALIGHPLDAHPDLAYITPGFRVRATAVEAVARSAR